MPHKFHQAQSRVKTKNKQTKDRIVSKKTLEQELKDLTNKSLYARRMMSDQINQLPSYFAENGPGTAVLEVINDIIKNNKDIEYYESEIRRKRYANAGLTLNIPNTLGAGDLSAQPETRLHP